jgi:hypothetical protein
MTDLDELIRAADPARGLDIPEPRWEHPRAVHPLPVTPARTRGGRVGLTGVRRGRPWLVAGLAAVAMGVLAAVLVAMVPGPTGPQSAAAAVLEEAAAAAGQQPVLPPGQYRYTETQTQVHQGLYESKPTGAEEVATAASGETDQSWAGSDGSAHRLLTVGARRYPSAADRAVWIAALTAQLEVQMTAWMDTGKTQTTVPLIDVANLPTDPSTLAAMIAANDLPVSPPRTGGSRGGAAQTIVSFVLSDGRHYSVFEGAAALLIGSTSGMTPALASALFKVMAAQPGVELLGTVTDHDGQQGQGLGLPTAGSTQVSEVIVDADSGQLLEAAFVLPPTAIPESSSCGGPAAATTTTTCVSSTGYFSSTAPDWTDVVARGVVGSGTTTAPPTGTIVPTATLVPAAPTDLTATAAVGGVRLAWAAPTDTGGGPVTDYLVARSALNSRSVQNVGSAATAFTYPTDTLDPTQATFTVQAVNADGYGPASAPVTVASVPTPPPVSLSP